MAAQELNGHEERYWHDFNDFQLQLRAHVEERDALLNKVVKRENEQPQIKSHELSHLLADVTWVSLGRGTFCCRELEICLHAFLHFWVYFKPLIHRP